MLGRVADAAERWTARDPWTNVYGLARSLLALCTLITLLLNPATVLFRPAAGVPDAPYCYGVRSASLFCVVPRDHLDVARWIGIVILIIVASGWRPALTAIPHWWVAFSLYCTATIPDGGDQAAAVLTLLLIPVALTDPRTSHWQRPTVSGQAGPRPMARLVAVVAKTAIRVQVSIIYFHAFVGKLQVPEWIDGTVLWYWLNDPTFGPAHWMRALVINFAATSIGIVLMTWGTLALEGSLAIALFLPPKIQSKLLIAGIAFHTGIALLMGLVSFGLAMISALTLYLRPWEASFTSPFGSMARTIAGLQGKLPVSPARSAPTAGRESVPARDV